MNTSFDTIAAVATGGVVSAIGILRVSGPDTLSVIDRVFTPLHGSPMSQRADRTLVFGSMKNEKGELLDVCLCTVSRGPRSYTGEDTAELQCHGSPVVLRMGLESLFAAGARQATAGEFTKRAFLNGCLDLTEAEAVIDLIDAETPAAARNAAGQLNGAISRKADGIYTSITEICAHFHAVLDYPDEDIEPFELENYRAVLQKCKAELSSLSATHKRGLHMEKGLPTAIIGRPNVGKSSLLNALLGYDRAIVTDIPGTTRDTLSERVTVGGVLLRLTDTAGMRESADSIEQIGVERSREALQSADLILAVFDGSAPLRAEDRDILQLLPGDKKVIALVNKCDLTSAAACELPKERFDALCRISAKTGEGLAQLEDAVQRVCPLPEVPAGEILTNTRQAGAVARAEESLSAALEAMDLGVTPDAVLTELENALYALGELTGRSIREDIVTNIFSRFCVGK